MDIKLNTDNPDINGSIMARRADMLKKVEFKGQGRNLSEQDKLGYAKVARGFESIFVHMMIKEMKKAMLEEEKGDNTFGANTLQEYSDLMLSDEISNTGKGIGIAEKVFKSFTGEELSSLTKELPKVEKFMARPYFRSDVPEKVQPNNNHPASSFHERLKTRIDNYEDIITSASGAYGVSDKLIKAIITAESAGKSDAVSSAGAKGLMQLMDGTARSLGVRNSFDPYQNIMGGTKYIRNMLDMFDGDIDLALAAYNAGPGNVMKYNGVPPFSETESYITRVKKYEEKFRTGEI